MSEKKERLEPKIKTKCTGGRCGGKKEEEVKDVPNQMYFEWFDQAEQTNPTQSQ